MDLPGVALITGAASGIGRATSLLFAAEGCSRIIIADVNLSGLSETYQLIKAAYPHTEVLATEVNLRNEDSVSQLIDTAISKFGRLDYCCNVAGVVLEGETAEGRTEDWELQYEVNLRGCFFCERAEIRALLGQTPLKCKDSIHDVRGSIVNIASLAGLIGYSDLPAYSAFKHGVVGLTKSDAMKYGMKGIRINSVCPGAVATAMTKNPEDEELLKSIGLGRIAETDEIAQAIVWLSSGRASYVHGTSLSINGGQRGI